MDLFSNHLNELCPEWEVWLWRYGGRGMLGTAWIFVLGREAAEGFVG